jgi:uroporphyrin-III C-methyltransferase / precorrin-2 dehydrogenase / sirohydrochlorin ferrochelatase
MTLFPAFLKLQNRPVLVVGGGSIAASKIPSLLEAGSQVTVVAPQLHPQLAERVRNHEITWLAKPFESSDLDHQFLVIAATALPQLNAHVFHEADLRNILCNAVDDIEHCHFYYGSIVQRGDLQIAISTNGKSPALAQRLRKELEQQFGPEYADWLNHLGETRERLRANSTDPESTKHQLHQLASPASFNSFLELSSSNDLLSSSPPHRGSHPLGSSPQTTCHPERSEGPAFSSSADQINKNLSFRAESAERGIPLSAPAHPLPSVFLIGAGPGDPDLLTAKAIRLLQNANIVLHDSLVTPEILALIPASTQRIDVGKRAGQRLLTQEEINTLLVDAARHHQIVVRLKGGDPLLFGRAAEEMDALRAANIAFEIVPGISAAFASAAAAQVSLTDRRLASRVLFTTFSRSADARAFSGIPIAPDTTVVVYMPGPDYAEVSQWLVDSGIVSETPCLLISKASQPGQSVRVATVSQLASLQPLPAPALLIIGRVASHSAASITTSDWLQQLGPEFRTGFLLS